MVEVFEVHNVFSRGTIHGELGGEDQWALLLELVELKVVLSMLTEL